MAKIGDAKISIPDRHAVAVIYQYEAEDSETELNGEAAIIVSQYSGSNGLVELHQEGKNILINRGTLKALAKMLRELAKEA